MAYRVKIKITKTDTKTWVFEDPAPPADQQDVAHAMRAIMNKVKDKIGEYVVEDNSTVGITVECPTKTEFDALTLKLATIWTPDETNWIARNNSYHENVSVATTVEEI